VKEEEEENERTIEQPNNQLPPQAVQNTNPQYMAVGIPGRHITR
jgi:hypothetical protein